MTQCRRPCQTPKTSVSKFPCPASLVDAQQRSAMKLGYVVAFLTLLFFDLHNSDVDAATRIRCRKVRIRKGRSRMLLRRTMIKYSCRSGYTLVGSSHAICMDGQWNRQPPVCVATGCPPVAGIGKLRVTQVVEGAVLSFACDKSHTLNGTRLIYCDGKVWNSNPPTCIPVGSESVCDFENRLCGWTNSGKDHFDWITGYGTTPTRYTGPSWDHTYGDGLNTGHYLFIETSNPRHPGDAAQLWSPMFPSNYSGKCFQFWYHMYGRVAVGTLSVLIKPKNQTFSDKAPMFSLTGNQGDEWRVGHVKIPQLNQDFQMIIQGKKNRSVYSDIAIDDVSVLTCPLPTTTSATTTATSTSVALQQENQTATQTVIEQNTSSGQTSVKTSELSTEHKSIESTVERIMTEAGTQTLGFTMKPMTTQRLFTVIYADTASKAEISQKRDDVTTWRTTEKEGSSTTSRMTNHTVSTMGNEPETNAEILGDVITKSAEDDVYSTIALKLATAEIDAITHDKEVMGTTEQSVRHTIRHTTRGEPLVIDTTKHIGDKTLATDIKQLTEHVTSNSLNTQQITQSVPVLENDSEVSDCTPVITGNDRMTTDNRHSIISEQIYPQAETAVVVNGASVQVIIDPTSPQPSMTATESSSPRRLHLLATTTERFAAIETYHTVLVNTRISKVVGDGLSTNSDLSTTERVLPVLRYNHRKVTHDISLISSLLALAALLSIAIGVVLWVIVNRRERARRYDQELTPIATAYSY